MIPRSYEYVFVIYPKSQVFDVGNASLWNAKASPTKSKSDLTLRSCPRWTLGVVQLKYQVYVLWAILASLWVLKIAAESCFLVGNMSERFDSRATGSHQVSDFASMSLVRRKKDNWCKKNSVLWCLVTGIVVWSLVSLSVLDIGDLGRSLGKYIL